MRGVVTVSGAGFERTVRSWTTHHNLASKRAVFIDEFSEEILDLPTHGRERRSLHFLVSMRKLDAESRRHGFVVFRCCPFLFFFPLNSYGTRFSQSSDVIVH